MTSHIFTPYPDAAHDPVARLDAMIADARSELSAAETEVAAIDTEIAAIEPHPHAHGHTTRGDCEYASFQPEHFLPLAGLLAQPWVPALVRVEAIRREQGFDYLLNAFPGAFAAFGDALDEDGAALIDARGDRIKDDLPELFSRRPMLALGMVWRLFGFDRRKRDTWVGAFAYGTRLSALIGSTNDITTTTMLGDALAATVAAHGNLLSAIGARELHGRAARRNAERQASWAELPENYRLHGPWRGWSPTERQRHMMQRIEAARGLPMPIAARRGVSSDAITGAGGNPRFGASCEEQA